MVLMLSGDVGRVFWSLDFELNKEFSWARFMLVRIRLGSCMAPSAPTMPRGMVLVISTVQLRFNSSNIDDFELTEKFVFGVQILSIEIYVSKSCQCIS